MAGIVLNNCDYILLHNDNNFKQLSLEDNVYFTLRDIFLNAESEKNFGIANEFNYYLTNNIPFEERKEDFKYTDVLYNYEYVRKLNIWLKWLEKRHFEFNVNVIPSKVDLTEYILFDKWWEQFNELRKQIDLRFVELTNHKD